MMLFCQKGFSSVWLDQPVKTKRRFSHRIETFLVYSQRPKISKKKKSLDTFFLRKQLVFIYETLNLSQLSPVLQRSMLWKLDLFLSEVRWMTEKSSKWIIQFVWWINHCQAQTLRKNEKYLSLCWLDKSSFGKNNLLKNEFLLQVNIFTNLNKKLIDQNFHKQMSVFFH